MKKFIVTTTINKPTEAVRRFDALADWTLIVVGDQKTHEPYELKNGIYLTPAEQEKLAPELSDLIGWNCMCRLQHARPPHSSAQKPNCLG
ncbi:MAG: hypothetical protein AAF362_01070, partial [Pseudomonadota bacterium]